MPFSTAKFAILSASIKPLVSSFYDNNIKGKVFGIHKQIIRNSFDTFLFQQKHCGDIIAVI